MTKKAEIKSTEAKGADIFKKILEDKVTIKAHLMDGKKISDLKDQFRFVKPLSTAGK